MITNRFDTAEPVVRADAANLSRECGYNMILAFFVVGLVISIANLLTLETLQVRAIAAFAAIWAGIGIVSALYSLHLEKPESAGRTLERFDHWLAKRSNRGSQWADHFGYQTHRIDRYLQNLSWLGTR